MRTAAALVAVLVVVAGSASCTSPSEDPKERVPEEKAAFKLRSEPIQPLRAPDVRASHVALGRKLFHEKRLSSTGEIACASCHVVSAGGADSTAHSRGVRGQEGSVNAPSVLNSGNNFALFWDGRAATLEEQAGGPLTNPIEMANTWEATLAFLRGDAGYKAAFDNAFPDGVTEANVRTAIATYERALVTPSRFDRWLLGDASAITEDERKGYELFKSVGCVACHQGRNVGGNMYQRFGVMGDYFKDRGNIVEADYGRYNVTMRRLRAARPSCPV